MSRARKRRRGLQPDEACADDDRAARILGAFDDGAAIGERAQRMDMRLVGARDRQPHRLGAGRQQQPVVGRLLPPATMTSRVFTSMPTTSAFEAQLDAVFGIESVRPQRQPVLRRAAGEIILRQVGPVDRRRGIIAQHDDAAAEAAPPQHLGRRKARRAAADNDNSSGARLSLVRPAVLVARAFP